MTILVCAPHPDDEVIGMGGTIAKYASEGKRVVLVLFTLGEGSHPWQKKEEIQKTREEEARTVNKIIGIEKTIFLRLRDLFISTEVVEKNTQETFINIIKQEQPEEIFTPAVDDVHADHKAVARFVIDSAKKIGYKQPIWMYTVWNPIHVTNRDQPQLIVDITDTLSKKWEAIQAYKSQKLSTYQLIPTVVLRGLIHGYQNNTRFAEVFVKAP